MKFINESTLDRVIRVIVGVILLGLGWSGIVTGGWGTFLKIFGFVPLLTGLVGYCAIYGLLKLRTNKA